MKKFNVTFDRVTQESAAQGDYAESGYIGQDLTLRHALQTIRDNGAGGYCEADSCPISAESPPRWFTFYGEMDSAGDTVIYSLHLPRGISGASAMRIARLVECYGVQP